VFHLKVGYVLCPHLSVTYVLVGGGRKGKESHSLLAGIVHLYIKNDSMLIGPSRNTDSFSQFLSSV
jgi:hypothetical protein